MNSRSPNKGTSGTPLIAHVIFRLDVGGLENGLVNLINQTPPDRFRHAIICVTEAADFRQRITASDVPIVELKKRPGKDFAVYWRFMRAILQLKPDVVHTRNFNTFEFQPLALLAGVRARIHGEHGWDVHDLDGTSRKYQLLRKLLKPFVHRFIVVSQGLHDYLADRISISPENIDLVYNGVDVTRFCPRESLKASQPRTSIAAKDTIVVGTVGRMKEVKNPRLLVKAFIELTAEDPKRRRQLRLMMIGDGPVRAELVNELNEAGVAELSALPGSRDNIAELIRSIDIFVLPSRNEGIPNTVLEAMATGLPVIATRVGGTPEVVQDGVTGILVENDDVEGLKAAMSHYADRPGLREQHGRAGLERVRTSFRLDAMVGKYLDIYSQSTS
jgi:sugar transferase (PEP-CTERM/EpsH1 system associated)